MTGAAVLGGFGDFFHTMAIERGWVHMTPTHPDTQERQGDRATAIRPRVTGVLGETRIHCVLSAEPQLFIHGAESISTSGGPSGWFLS